MMVRCGACRTQFDAPGPGRFSCPACGSINMIRDASGATPPPPPQQQRTGGYPTAPGVQGGGVPPPPPPPPPDKPVPKIDCPECGFSFHVGEVAMVVCPNCTAEVPTGLVEFPNE